MAADGPVTARRGRGRPNVAPDSQNSARMQTYLKPDEADALYKASIYEERPASAIIRDALQGFLLTLKNKYRRP